MSKAHPGFKNVAAEIARRQGVSTAVADAMLSKRTRESSDAAKRANPHLKKVK